MMWDTLIEYSRRNHLAIIASIIISIVAFFSQLNALFFISILLLAFTYLPEWYAIEVKKQLLLINKKQKQRLFIGDESELQFTFINRSFLPILSVTCSFQLDDFVALNAPNELQEQKFTFSIKSRGKFVKTLPIQAVSRGMAKIRRIQLEFYDPFRLKKNNLAFKFIYRKEFIVYPNQKPVQGLKSIMTNEEGFLPRPYALYKDMTSISGTRPYLPGDSLRMIHWKATAKTGELQTKTYEPSTGMTWTVALIFDTSINGIMTREQMEQLVSEAAYICHYAHQNQIQLEIFTNIKPPGREMIFHINLDQSTSHLAKVMELLAMIQGNQIKTRISDALNEMDHHITFPRQIFFIGRAHLDADDYFLQKWRRYGHQCYRVNEENNMAYLTPLNKGAVS